MSEDRDTRSAPQTDQDIDARGSAFFPEIDEGKLGIRQGRKSTV